ncbi:RelA/SpoT domain-containing protein [Curvibacter sp. CHRR-16]|uniref:RelA/SpoT domain-containing protein n=1 Tax=Curvibacter sp. CHRR-16 TaxID=2835872 RepID=UPI001BDB64C2|nr:RelA/SpoT domain-containing protein [Curvibacter sp. CHRR-16]MBT0569314.1 RelA/SpoT domain-containing protein [Curvibacter sp. CHRR-16]
MTLSNSQITQLGDRLRSGDFSEDDLAMLDVFRQTYSEIDELAYQLIQSTLASTMGWTSTKRKRKTQQSIVDKLCRLPQLRLPQMQDIAGCRIVIEGGSQMADSIGGLLTSAFEPHQWKIERKERHAHGYRATHIIAKTGQKFYEIQLRTYAQDVWANTVEGLSDEKNTLKYGGSDQEQEQMSQLQSLAERFAAIDLHAHEVSFEGYQQQIQKAINDVLSN